MGAGGARPWIDRRLAVTQARRSRRADRLRKLCRTLWLNALKMTVIPLVVALLVVGISKSAEAAHAGRIAGRSVIWIAIICTVSAVFGALMILLLTRLFPLPRETAAGLQTALAGIESKAPASLPGIAEFFKA